MSRILDFIIGIFTFSDPTASAAFYIALILIPALTWILGKKSPQLGTKVIGIVMRGVAVVLGVVGIAILFIIAGSSEDLDFTKGTEIDGKEIVKMDVRGQEDPILVSEGSYFIEKASVSEEVQKQNIENNPDKYSMLDGKYVERMDAPDLNIVTQVYFKDGGSKKVVDGAHWDQDAVGTAIQLSMIVIFICFGLMLGYGLTAIVENPRKAKNPLIVMGGLILVFLIGYGIESSFFTDLPEAFVQKMEKSGETITDTDQTDAGGGIMVTFIMIGLAIVPIAVFGVINMIKMRK